MQNRTHAGTVLGRPHPNTIQVSNRENSLSVPRVWRFHEARNVRRYSFEEYLSRLSVEEQQAIQIVVATTEVCYLEAFHQSVWRDLVVCWSVSVALVLAQQSRAFVTGIVCGGICIPVESSG